MLHGLNCVSSKIHVQGNSLVVQWLRLSTFTAKCPGSIPGQGTKIPEASRSGIYIYICRRPSTSESNLFGCNFLRGHHMSNMTNVIIKGNLNADMHTGRTHVKMKAEIRVMVL